MPRPIELDVYETDGTTLVGTLASDGRRSFLVALDARGTLATDVLLDHADAPLLTPGRIVRAVVDGSPRFSAVLGTLDDTEAGDARAAGRVRAFSAVDATSLLADAAVYSELGLQQITPGTRYFNPASFDYDVSGWDAATELKIQGAPGPPWNGAPQGFPDYFAWWIGAPGDDTPPVAPGYRWAVVEFDVDAGHAGEVRFFLSADDGFLPYLDGDRKPGEQAAGLWGTTRYFDAILDAGTHRLAVRVVNFDRPNPDLNACGFILSGRVLLDGGKSLGDVIVHTDASWSILVDPPNEPGMTPGKILDVALAEAQFRGTLAGFSWDFDGVVDSDGIAWPAEYDLAVDVGASITDLIAKLVAEDAVEVALDPASLTLHAWPRRGSDLSATVAVDLAVDVAALDVSRLPPGKNVVVSRTAEGRYVETVDAAAVAAHGRREAFLSLSSAPSDDAADRQALAFLAQNADGAVVLTNCRVEITPTSPIPFVDYNVGDDITVAGTPRRVLAIGVTEDAAGHPIYALELGDRLIRDPASRLIVAVSNMSPGSGAGSFDAVGPADPSGESLGTLDKVATGRQRFVWSHPRALTVTAVGDATEDEVEEPFDTLDLVARLKVAGTSDTVFALDLNGTQVGAITVPSGSSREETTVKGIGASTGDGLSVRCVTPGTDARTATLIGEVAAVEAAVVSGGDPGSTPGPTSYDGDTPTTTYATTLDGGVAA